ncbi:MAG TPA: hypothetical protein PLB10_09120 [Thiolinea sp.]|nr:hypothetical protein [Thiolinea sp.]
MGSPEINSHTLYSHYARLLQQAHEVLAQADRYLQETAPDGQPNPNYLPVYIEKLKQLRTVANPPADIEARIARQESHLQQYRQRSAKARQILAEYPGKLRAIELANNVFQAPAAQTDDCLFILDQETCSAHRVRQEGGVTGPGEVTDIGADTVFRDRHDIELCGENQTDAVRVWSHRVRLENLTIQDRRSYDTAHRDAIQLIPPALGYFEAGEDGKQQYVRVADQMAGAVLEDVVVQGCTIRAPRAPLQGIFASDGFCRRICIRENDITIRGAHAISIAGMLDDCEISGNVLHQAERGEPPAITLYPGRIGGNMAEDGVVAVLGFAGEPEALRQHYPHQMQYGPVSTDAPNRCIPAGAGAGEGITIHDSRTLLPASFLRMGAGLQDFHYHAYLQAYSSLTLAQYQVQDPFGARMLEAWLETRSNEYAGGRPGNPVLGPVSPEQQQIGERFLKPALEALRSGTLAAVRLVDIEHSAIRSFVMKRLAILQGQVEPLAHIALDNARRDQTLAFILTPEQRANIVRMAFLDAGVRCAETGQPAAGLGFRVFFDGVDDARGVTGADGCIALSGLPLGPCLLRLDDPALTFVPAGATPVPAGVKVTEAATHLAGTLLKYFRDRLPVVAAYLAHDEAHADYCLGVLERWLAGRRVTLATVTDEPLKQEALSVLGVMASFRAPERRTISLQVDCHSREGSLVGRLAGSLRGSGRT